MPLFSELELPVFDTTDASLRGEHYREAMTALHGHDGWLAACPFGALVLDREASEFFLRTKDAVFPGLTIAELFSISDGPLHEEILRNIININGDDHRRLRNLVNPALTPRAVDRYRLVMREFLAQLLSAVPAGGSPPATDTLPAAAQPPSVADCPLPAADEPLPAAEIPPGK